MILTASHSARAGGGGRGQVGLEGDVAQVPLRDDAQRVVVAQHARHRHRHRLQQRRDQQRASARTRSARDRRPAPGWDHAVEGRVAAVGRIGRQRHDARPVQTGAAQLLGHPVVGRGDRARRRGQDRLLQRAYGQLAEARLCGGQWRGGKADNLVRPRRSGGDGGCRSPRSASARPWRQPTRRPTTPTRVHRRPRRGCGHPVREPQARFQVVPRCADVVEFEATVQVRTEPGFAAIRAGRARPPIRHVGRHGANSPPPPLGCRRNAGRGGVAALDDSGHRPVRRRRQPELVFLVASRPSSPAHPRRDDWRPCPMSTDASVSPLTSRNGPINQRRGPLWPARRSQHHALP